MLLQTGRPEDGEGPAFGAIDRFGDRPVMQGGDPRTDRYTSSGRGRILIGRSKGTLCQADAARFPPDISLP